MFQEQICLMYVYVCVCKIVWLVGIGFTNFIRLSNGLLTWKILRVFILLNHFLFRGSHQENMTIDRPRSCTEVIRCSLSPPLTLEYTFYPLFHSGSHFQRHTLREHSSHMLVKKCLKFSKPGFTIREPWTSRCSSWF